SSPRPRESRRFTPATRRSPSIAPPSTGNLTRRATFSRAWATRATESSAPERRRRAAAPGSEFRCLLAAPTLRCRFNHRPPLCRPLELVRMRLTEILKPSNIKVPLRAKVKNEAIAELVNMLAANGEVTDPKKVLESVLDREAT